jgi:hypothetical protein
MTVGKPQKEQANVAHNKDEASLLLVKAIIERSLAVEEVLKI